MAEDPRDKRTSKTPPERVAQALASGGVPRDFAEDGRQPITGVGLSPVDELNERAKRLQSTTDATRMTVTGQLTQHGQEIVGLKSEVAGVKGEVAGVKSDMGEMKVSMATIAGQMPLMVTAVQDLTSAAIQRETVTTTTQIEISGAKQIAEIDVEKTARKAKIETRTKLVAIVSTLLALGLAILEALR